MQQRRSQFWTAMALALATTLGALPAHADTQSPLVGFWACTGENGGINYVSTFDYQPDGSYLSTQYLSAGASSLQGGGAGVWRYEDGVLHDTKQRATLDRFVRDGIEVPSSDPEWQEMYRQSQSNIGQTVSGEIQIEGDIAYSGIYTCHRRR